MASVGSQSLAERLGEVFELTLPKLSPEARAQLASFVTPQSLAIIAGVVGAWIVGHAFGIGELIDVVLGVVGVVAIGMAVFSGLDELFEFARGTYFATSEADLEAAANPLAKAIAILGIQAVLALLFKGRPKGARVSVGPEPVSGNGLRYRPEIVQDPGLPAGSGSTTFWGDVEVSTAGTSEDRAVVLLHEKVHQFLAPKFYKLRRLRVENRVGSYFKTSLYRYVEEALAETIGQLGVNGAGATHAQWGAPGLSRRAQACSRLDSFRASLSSFGSNLVTCQP
jgi:uncharacterized membrane protein YeaQ/YmgE (transglycosylase-associated protein family)